MAYADYAFYTTVYHGSLIPAERFDTVAERASEEIDYLTLGRATAIEPVQKACCAAAEIRYAEECKGGIAGASYDGLSVTYKDDGKTAEQRTCEAIMRHLRNTGYLYRGVY